MLCLKVADNPPKKQRILVGLVNSTAALLLYAPLAGYLCSFSVASQSIAIRYNLSTISVSSLNSIAFGLSVGLGPLTKQFIFDKLGLYKGTIVGYAIAMLGMLSSAYASEYWQLILTYSVLASIGNNCCYMGLNCLAEGWLAGTRWLTTGAVLVSCAISVGTWLGNSASSALQQKIKNETLASLIQSSASNSNEILLDATSSSKTLTNQDFLISSKFIQQRFLLFAAAILVALVIFAVIGRDPPTKKLENSSSKNSAQDNSETVPFTEPITSSLETTTQVSMTVVEAAETDVNNDTSKTTSKMSSTPQINYCSVKIWTYLLATILWGIIFTIPYTIPSAQLKICTGPRLFLAIFVIFSRDRICKI